MFFLLFLLVNSFFIRKFEYQNKLIMQEFQAKFSLKVNQTTYPKIKITQSKVAYETILNYYDESIEIYESFYLVLLNTANETIGFVKLSQGGITGTVVDLRLLMKYVLDTLASGVIIAHNHPSGNLKPSEADKIITKKINSALKLIDVTLLDHLIITPYGFLSFADEGILTFE